MPSLDEILNRPLGNIGTPPVAYPPTRVVTKKLLIVLSFWDGDRAMMASLCRLIADLQESPSATADILLYYRNDARPMESEVVQRLAAKFPRVQQVKCRRMNARGYPMGANEMFYDLIELFRQDSWRSQYFGFLNMEADCVPLVPDWIDRLASEYRSLSSDGAYAIGHIYSYTAGMPDHLNGSALYSMEIFDKAGGMEILGGPGGIAYDFHHAKRFLPISKDTPLMAMDFNRKTITAGELFSKQKLGQSPVYLHGVKDLSAQTAVRVRFIDKSGASDLASKTIITYFDPRPALAVEQQAQLDAWKEAWATAGWNPVVSNRYDSERNPRFLALQKSLALLPAESANDTRKWLALEYTGGGLYCDFNVLPRHSFAPGRLMRHEGTTIYGEQSCMVWADRESAGKLAAAELDGSKTEQLVREVGSEGWGEAAVVRFSKSACEAYSPSTPVSRVMLHFFRARQ